MAIAWSSDLETGIDVIDNQHRRIVDYINQLGDVAIRQDRNAVGRVLEDLVDYTLSHFAFEESLQDEAGYPLAKPHKAVHTTFARRVAAFQAKHAAGEEVAAQLHSMLGTWLIHHIKRDDMAYVSAIRPRVTNIVADRKEGGWVSRALAKFFK